jgi:hypothetical protein
LSSRACRFHPLSAAFLVVDELAVDDVGQPPFQRPDRFHRRLPRGELAPVVRPSFGVVAAASTSSRLSMAWKNANQRVETRFFQD